MNQEVTKAEGKPALDQESFQRLLAAAFILQSLYDSCHAKPIYLRPTQTFTARAIVQTRTPSQRKILEPAAWRPDRWPPIVQFTAPTLWRTVEAVVIAAIFCLMLGLSTRRVLSFHGNRSLPAVRAGQPTVQADARPDAKIQAISQPPIVTSSPSLPGGKDDVIAKDFVVRYPGRAVAPRDNPAAKRLATHAPRPQPGLSENTNMQSGGRLTFGVDTDVLAADTVLRYAPRLQSSKRP